MKRWTKRILLSLAILLVLIVAIVQVIFWSDLPKNLVIDIVQRQLKLRLDADSLSTGWLGNTTLRNVTLTLPLEEDSFVTVPEMRVSHTSPLGVVFGRPIAVYSIAIQQPHLIIRQQPSGEWDIQEVVELVSRVGGGDAAAGRNASKPALKLPELTINNAQVTIIDNQQRQSSLQPLTVHGRPSGPLVYAYDAAIPGHVDLKGRVVPGGPWRHEVDVQITDLAPFARPLVPAWPEPVAVNARWEGSLDRGVVTGRLLVDRAQVSVVQASGAVQVSAGGASVSLEPQRLTLAGPFDVLTQVIVNSGAIRVEGSTVTLDNLELAGAGGAAQFNGIATLAGPAADLKLTWQDLTLPRGTVHSGELRASLQTPIPHQPQVSLAMRSTGSMGDDGWNARINLAGNGTARDSIDWTLTAEQLRLTGKPPVRIHNVVANLRTRGSIISLDQITLPGPAELAARGEVRLDERSWWIWVHGDRWTLPRTDFPLRFNLDAWGSPERLALKQLYLAVGELEATGAGAYVFHDPKPLDLQLALNHQASGDLIAGAGGPPIRGRLSSELRAQGTISPRDIEISGFLNGRQLRYEDRPLGYAMVQLTGVISEDRAEIRSTDAEMLGGKWRVGAVYPIEEEQRQVLRIGLAVDDLPVGTIAALAQRASDRPTDGTINARFFFMAPSLKREDVFLRGRVEARDVAAGMLKAETIDANLSLREGRFRIAPIELTLGEGRGRARFETNLRQLSQANLDFSIAAWPVQEDGAEGSATLWTDGNFVIDLKNRGITGPLNATAAVFLRDQPLGQVELKTEMLGRVIRVSEVGGDIFDGSLAGGANLYLDQPLESTFRLEWKQIDFGQLKEVFPFATDLQGKLSGNLFIAPSRDPRALGPLRADMQLSAQDLNFRGVPFTGGSLRAYLNTRRAVLERSTLHLAGGDLRVWGRAGIHPTQDRDGQSDRNFNVHTIIEFDGLDLDQLVHAVDPESDPKPGRLAGSMTLVGDPRDYRRLFGQGTVNLSESDLGNVDAIAFLYNSMNLIGGEKEQAGHGTIDLRLEGEHLSITRMDYFDRGVEIIANAEVQKVFEGTGAQVNATLVGSARPFKDTKIPFAGDVDDIFGAIQSSATTVLVDGQLNDYRIRQATLAEIGASMRSILFGEVRK